jgi:hypothetical protein
MTEQELPRDRADDFTTTAEPGDAAGGEQLARPAAVPTTGAATRSLASLGLCVGCGLAILGIVAGILAFLEPAVAEDTAPAAHAGRWLHAAWPVLAFGLAGWGAWVFLRVVSTAIVGLIDRDSRRARELAAHLDRANRLLERLVEVLEQRGETRRSQPGPDFGRAQAVSRIESATQSAQWSEALTLLDEFEAAYPGDAKSASLRTALERARQGTLDERLAELKAAREVNDPARVLELYRAIAPALEPEARHAIQTELAKWFLALIYRRLRAGKIQPEVVDLAGRFAESFAATVEGASVKAALPTLRRSAGLCTRCAQPYTGMAQACPECLGQRTVAPTAVPPSLDPLERNEDAASS